jgi:hypothetical protein
MALAGPAVYMASESRPVVWYVTAVASVGVGTIPIVILDRWFGVPRKGSGGFGVVAGQPPLRPRQSLMTLSSIEDHVVVDRAVRRGTDHRTAAVILGVRRALRG